jgi:Kef-type K+ transport system membrane component KefB
MTSIEFFILFFQLSLILISAMVCSYMARKLNQPLILGELVAGIFIGSTVLGYVFPEFYYFVFKQFSNVNIVRDSLLLIGLLFFLFITGMEVNLNQIRGRIRQVVWVSGLGILIPFLLGVSLVLLFPTLWNDSNEAKDWVLPFFMGIAFSISALPVIARILLDLKLLDKDLGSVILTSAVLSDIVGWALFALCLNLIKTDGANANLNKIVGSVIFALTAISLVTYFVGKYVLHWFNKKNVSGAWIGTVSIFIFASAALAEWLEIHPVLGAFIVGVIFTQHPLSEADKQSQRALHQIAVYLFAPLYFASVGLKVNFIENFDFLLVGVVTLVGIVSKIIGAGIGARISGFDGRTSLAIGFGMSARGVMEIILALVALENNIINQRVFVALVVMALVTSMVSGIGLKYLMKNNHQ